MKTQHDVRYGQTYNDLVNNTTTWWIDGKVAEEAEVVDA